MAQKYRVPLRPEEFPLWVREAGRIINAFFRELSDTAELTAGSTQTQAGAAQLILGFNRITSASANDGVRLALSEGGEEVIIRNDSGAAIQIWPPSGGTIDGGSANAVDSNTLADGSSRAYKAIGLNWYTIYG